jgi:hypothetical protein
LTFIRSSPENGARILAAIRDFGFASLPISLDDFTTPNRLVRLRHEPNRIDLMTANLGVSFDEAWLTRVAGTDDGLSVRWPGGAFAKQSRRGTPERPIDIEALRKANS